MNAGRLRLALARMSHPSIRAMQVQGIVITACVIAAFVTVNVVCILHATRIDRDAAAIVGNAMPGVDQLAQVRGAVHRLDAAVDEWVDVAREGGTPAPGSVDGLVGGIEDPLARYRALPGFPDADEAFTEVRAQVSALEGEARRVAEAVRSRDVAGAEAAFSDEQRSAHAADAALERLARLNIATGERLGRDVAAVRHSTQRMVMGLTSLAGVLTALAAALSIAALRRSMVMMQQAQAFAERRSVELDRFAGRAAHDILSPLTAVRMSVQQCARRVGGGDAVIESALQRATRSVDRVNTLVDGLLGYARAGAQPSPEAMADVDDVVRDVLDDLRREAEDHAIRLESDGLRGAKVASTVVVLTSLLSNLVRNAIKYMGDGPRRVVTVHTVTTEERVRIEVEDTGPGVPAEIADSVFEPFVRGASDKDGIGLGLATVRQLTRAHGGLCGVRSRPGDGSVFWFELPRGGRASA